MNYSEGIIEHVFSYVSQCLLLLWSQIEPPFHSPRAYSHINLTVSISYLLP